MKYSAKTKIYFALLVWLILSVSMASFGFGIVEKSSEALTQNYSDQMRELNMLKAENLSFNLSKSDLADLRKKATQPEDFFSQDVTLVNEIKFLEDLTESLDLDFSLSGLSGTVKSAVKAKTSSSEIITLPYSVGISGNFAPVLAFIKTMEHLPFASQISSVSINAISENKVNATFSAAFYIRK